MNKLPLFLALVFILVGCEMGPAGPTGPQGQPGTGIPAYSVEFENAIYPDNGYGGCDPHWLDGGNPNNAPGTGRIEVATGTASSNVALGLVRFNLSYAVPVNATITSASLQLTTQTTTNLSSGTYIFGVHQVIPPPAGQVPWNDASTWNVVVAPFGWNGGASSPITAGVDFNSNLMDAVTVTSTQVNSNQVLLAWNITPSLAQVWVNPSNNTYGILISPEPETSGTLSGFLSFWDNTGNNQQKPKMLVTYTIP
jgi:hypothetical protein